jgi:hypothetical protein
MLLLQGELAMKRCCVVAFLFTLSTGLFAHDTELSAFLLGSEEVPGPGDTDGFGEVTLFLQPRLGQICFLLNVDGIDTATAAHIHEGEEGVAGPIVVTLGAPTDGSSGGCVAVSSELIRDIKRHPDNYYVNVHNSLFPAGAIRGQLACDEGSDR